MRHQIDGSIAPYVAPNLAITTGTEEPAAIVIGVVLSIGNDRYPRLPQWFMMGVRIRLCW